MALTRTEVAALFGVDARTVSRAIDDGTIPSVRLGRRVFVPRVRLLDLLTQAQAHAPADQ
ncbi:helix-turn-helix domain-containing protein [Rhodococcus sp. 24CO]|uniref:helix-turn-helix domain-containing protein n=1 Tax=Rhodococcus sp. 24CO TaxID=3117460 RepID=UPI003D341E80